MPTPKSIARKLQKGRKDILGAPALPTDWESMVLPENLKLTVQGDRFLIMEKVVGHKGEKIFGFASDNMLSILNSSQEWFVDGTFDVTRHTLFAQVRTLLCFQFVYFGYFQAWIIVAKIGEFSVPCAFFLLPDKTWTSYQKCLQSLVENNIMGPTRVHLDYEAGEQKAFSDVFPTTSVTGCDFHFKQALRYVFYHLNS